MGCEVYCKHCNERTVRDKSADQLIHLWSWSPWCSMGRPSDADTVAELE